MCSCTRPGSRWSEGVLVAVVLTGWGLDVILAEEVLVVVLTGEGLGVVLAEEIVVYCGAS